MKKLMLLLALPIFASGQQNMGVSALDLGCVGDGSTSNNACMSAVASSSRSVYFPAGTYLFSNPVTVIHPIIISGEGNGLSVLSYRGTGATAAITWNPISSLNYGMGLRDIGLTGTSPNGLLVGGNNQAIGFECFACRISGFTTAGVSFGNNTWNILFDHSVIFGTPVVLPAGLPYTGEEMVFSHTAFASGSGYTASCVNILGLGNLVFDDDAFDGCQFVLNSSGAQVSIRDSHFDDPNGTATVPYLVLKAGVVELSNPNVWVASFSGITGVFSVSGGMLNMIDGNINTGSGALPEWISASNGTVNIIGSAYLGNVGSVAANRGSANIKLP